MQFTRRIHEVMSHLGLHVASFYAAIKTQIDFDRTDVNFIHTRANDIIRKKEFMQIRFNYDTLRIRSKLEAWSSGM